jgi:gas vesicle protein
MSPLIVSVLAGSLIIVCATLLIAVKEGKKLRKLIQDEQRKNQVFAQIFHKVDDLLTSVKWHTEMLETKDSGELNISQQQLLHKVDTSVTKAAKLLQERYKVTSDEIDVPLKESDS